MTTVLENSPELESARTWRGGSRDFKTCEMCGQPAAQHPRLDFQKSYATERPMVLCCACLHDELAAAEMATSIPKGRFTICDQIWQCVDCGVMRAWGYLFPENRGMRPALNCKKCQAPTRHRFAGVA